MKTIEASKLAKGKLYGKVAVVTGAGRGIGRAIALTFAKEGANVVVASRTKLEIDAVAEEIHARGFKAVAVAADVSRKDEVERMIQTSLEKFRKIDILVNNAGIFPERMWEVSVSETGDEDWDLIMRVNLRGLFLCTKAVLDHMKERRRGYILNISSMSGKRAISGAMSAYVASKHGVMGFTKCLAKDVEDYNISVSAICPGIVDTSLQPESRREKEDSSQWLTPEDIAEVALFLVTRSPKIIIPEIMIFTRGELKQRPLH